MAQRRTSTTQTIKPVGKGLQVELFGDWDKAKRLVKGLEGAMAAGAVAGQLAAAEKIKDLVKKKIRSNGGSTPWQEYSEAYLKYKRNKKPSKVGQMYRFTDAYYNNIVTWRSGTRVYVGLNPRIAVQNADGKSKGITLHQLSQILEYGSSARNIPARPLWGPVKKEFNGAKIKLLILWHIKRSIKTMTGVSTSTIKV